MIPNREINELARAMMQTDEYKNMMKYRSKIFENNALKQKTMQFERERTRILQGNLSPIEISDRLNRLFNEYKSLLDMEEIKNLAEVTKRYQKMFADCMAQLHRSMDSSMNRR